MFDNFLWCIQFSLNSLLLKDSSQILSLNRNVVCLYLIFFLFIYQTVKMMEFLIFSGTCLVVFWVILCHIPKLGSFINHVGISGGGVFANYTYLLLYQPYFVNGPQERRGRSKITLNVVYGWPFPKFQLRLLW